MRNTLVMICIAIIPSLALAQSDANLAQKAKKVLQTHCYRCHGENGQAEGGVNYILDAKLLAARGKIIPGAPEKSSLLKRVLAGDMPADDGPLAVDQIQILRSWIAAGAPDFNPAADRLRRRSPSRAIRIDRCRRPAR